MHRPMLPRLVVLAAVCLALFHAMPLGADEKKKPVPLRDRLNERISIDFKDSNIFQDQKTLIQEALDWLADRYGLTYELNEKAFEIGGGKADDRLKEPLLGKGPFPAIKEVALSTVLQKIISRMPSDGGTSPAWMLRKDHIEITTFDALITEIYGNETGPYLTLVNVDFLKRPLDEALKDLADRSDVNVVVDARVEDKVSKTLVTAQFTNTPVDTAARLIADMADLKIFLVDNVIYVTTPERAAAMEAEQERQIEKGRRKGPRVGQGRYYTGKGPGGP